MIRYATIEDAKNEVLNWNGDPSTVEHLGDRGNSVFLFRTSRGESQILRFTDPEFRSFEELLAELNFINHLHERSVPVAKAIPDSAGRLAFLTDSRLICSSISFIDGIEIWEGSPLWNQDLFKAWGRNIALIHEGAASFPADPGQRQRWQWDEEILIARAQQLIPHGDSKSLEEFHEVLAQCKSLSKSNESYGLIHADHAPQNFRYDAETKSVIAFDFGNCCYHWFMSDLAIALSTVRRKSNRDEIRDKILEGYSNVRTLPKNHNELLELFIRLRVVYVYLSRLHLWSHDRTPEQSKDLALFRDLVHAKSGWGSVRRTGGHMALSQL